MRVVLRRIIFAVLIAAVLAGIGAASERLFVDLAGRELRLPENPRRLVTFVGPTPEKILMLGVADRLVGKNAYAVAGAWALEVYPKFGEIALFKSPMDPNVEELVGLAPDIIYYWSMNEQIERLESAGLKVVVAQLTANNPSTVDEFIAFQKREVDVIADSIGEETKQRAKLWNGYFDEKVQFVRERTAALSERDRKKVYFSCSDDGLECFSKNSYPQFIVELAGGIFAAKDTNEEVNTTVSLEEIINWNPDLIIMGRTDSTDGVLKDERWNEIAAVKNGNVILPPDGVMFWDYSSECVLLMQFLAKTMYPELFTDLDMVAETKAYYEKFYNYELSDENARNILSHLPPAK
ncbi:MAG: ABC transporter substrate-binding protein [Synergistaceae bacterium]|nr:ABC transporter substrate-binding protein [Synergistaceae bacterium]